MKKSILFSILLNLFLNISSREDFIQSKKELKAETLKDDECPILECHCDNGSCSAWCCGSGPK